MALRYLTCSFSFLVMELCLLSGEKPGSVELLKVGGGRRLESTLSDGAKVPFSHLVCPSSTYVMLRAAVHCRKLSETRGP